MDCQTAALRVINAAAIRQSPGCKVAENEAQALNDDVANT